MPYNEQLANRVREIIALTHNNIEEKKMFSGLCFMVNDKMCVGIHENKIMVRLDPELYDTVMEKEGCEPMDFTGKIMKGFVYVNANALQSKKQLNYWIQLALEYNKVAKSSRKKKMPAKKK
jgi:TfoX/Sxy family transcriptional regulator of competence genes